MDIRVINSDQAPAAIGAYSQAVAVGNAVYVSGQLGIDPATGAMETGFTAQCHRMFGNLKAVCEGAGGNLQQIVKMTIFVTDLACFAELNEIMSGYIQSPYPARAVVQVVALPKGGLVEADAIMVV